MASGPRVLKEEMHPDPPGRAHRGICGAMILVGVALVVVAALSGGLWGPVRILFGVAGVVLVIAGFLLALGVTKLKIAASGDGGIEASADMPTGYTKTMTVSDSLVEGTDPPKQGSMPPKDGVMPPKGGTMPAKDVRDTATLGLPGPAAEGTAPDHPRSSAEP
jgi:hypothetical protein